MADPHRGQPVLRAGPPADRARAAMICVHGRGATPEDILLGLGPLAEAPGLAILAPRAAGGSWYPQPFTAPLERNEPWLSSALRVLDGLAEEVRRSLPGHRLILLGFSQGACLVLEFAARRPRRFGGVVGWSGALIGPPPREASGSLLGTPVLLGCSDRDPYVPVGRVREAAEVLGRLGGEVDLQVYPGMGHEVNADEQERVARLVAALTHEEEEVRRWQ